jgi:hypothetical protein
MRRSRQSEFAANSKSRHAMKKVSDLTEREVLAVAIASEEEDGHIYMSFAENLVERYPESARIFEQMAEEEKGHRYMLLKLYEQRFGPNLPPIRREDVKGPASPPDLADTKFAARDHPQGSGDHGARGRATGAGRQCAQAARRSRR